jgi:putative NIF3 family GTP cyclohydrolase 1 type 2
MNVTVQEVTDLVLEYAPLDGGIPGDQNGLLYGDPAAEVTGVATAWTPTVRVLQEAAAEGLNFVLTHEIPWFVASESAWFPTLAQDDRPHNLARRRVVDRHGLAICRCHSNWDGVPEHGIADSCARALGFGEPVWRDRYVRLYRLAPRTVAQLAQECKALLGVPHVRVAGDLSRVVERVGIAYGGFGQSWHCLDVFLMQGAEAVILGEAIDYTFRAAVDSGLAVIETSHVGSENPGMREFARLLQGRLPNLPVRFLDAGHPWVTL